MIDIEWTTLASIAANNCHHIPTFQRAIKKIRL